MTCRQTLTLAHSVSARRGIIQPYPAASLLALGRGRFNDRDEVECSGEEAIGWQEECTALEPYPPIILVIVELERMKNELRDAK